ncbi:hypothetical protein ACIA8H_36915 [Streptomyces goshikiensis]|uniref:hypothetical protein n=1 Tax=Streptomyces goshikiensis TaxID=1942 RepID=UPI00379BB422
MASLAHQLAGMLSRIAEIAQRSTNLRNQERDKKPAGQTATRLASCADSVSKRSRASLTQPAQPQAAGATTAQFH